MPFNVKASRVPERVVSLAASHTETIYALGVGDRLVGVTRYPNERIGGQDQSRMGDFADVDVDRVAKLQPDLVITGSGAEASVRRHVVGSLVERGLPVLSLNPQTVTEIFRDIVMLGKLFGVPERAEALVCEMNGRVDAVRDAAATFDRRPRIYCEAWGPSEPYRVAARWCSELAQLAGGHPVLVDTTARPARALSVSLDAIRECDPDLIVVSWRGFSDQVDLDAVRNRPGWSSLRAIASGRIHAVDNRLLGRPGPRIIEGLETLHELLADCQRK